MSSASNRVLAAIIQMDAIAGVPGLRWNVSLVFTEVQRTGLVTDAWTLGLRALMNAYKQAEESRLSDIGRTLKDDIDTQLVAYIERQQATFVQVLARYFDPRDGQVVIRDDADKLSEEVRKGGNALDLLLRKAKTTLKALDVELTEAQEAKAAPVMLPAASLVQARAALGPVQAEALAVVRSA